MCRSNVQSGSNIRGLAVGCRITECEVDRYTALMKFRNREDAAERLLPLIQIYKRHSGVVFGIPRGGVPIATRVSRFLEWKVSALLVKKISHPDNHEYAIGAVGLQGAYIDPQHRSISERYLKREIDIQRAILRRRMVDYHLKPVDVSHRTVMIVDDGIATGLTMRYAVEIVRSQHPRCIVVVSPVASMDAVRLLRPIVEDLIVLNTPSSLGAIGEWYESFDEVSDEDVIECLSIDLHHEHQSMGRTLRRR